MEKCEVALANSEDEIREMFCESCDKDDEYAAANGFCVKCVEYLCSTCLKYHKRLKSDHALQTKTDMPQDFGFERCEIHSREIIKFYCSSCKTCFCKECRLQTHMQCSNIYHIPQIVKDYEIGIEYKGLTNTIELLTDQAPNIEDRIKSNLKQIKTLGTFIKREITQYRKEINAKLDQLQAAIDLKIALIQRQDELKLNNLITKLNVTVSEITEMKSELDKQLLSGDRSSLFTVSQKALKDIVILQETLKEIDEGKAITECTFLTSEELTQTLNNMDTLGVLSVLGHEREFNTVYKTSIYVEEACDISKCNLTGMTVLSDLSKLVVADNCNKDVKVVGLVNKKIVGHLTLYASPWDVTEVFNSSAKEVAVTIPDLETIQFLVLERSGFMHRGRQIKVRQGCRGIASCELGFVLSYSSIGRVEILDTKGNILKTISTDLNGEVLFKAPEYILVNHLQGIIYVSDNIKNSVYCFSQNGVFKSSFEGETVRGMALDRFGNVIMCSQNCNLRMLLPDLNTCLPVFSSESTTLSEKKSSLPQCCVFNNGNNCLYVSWKNDPEIRILHVAYKNRHYLHDFLSF